VTLYKKGCSGQADILGALIDTTFFRSDADDQPVEIVANRTRESMIVFTIGAFLGGVVGASVAMVAAKFKKRKQNALLAN
jgi:uncharacterized membrane protein YsdA (DUF1294 family)